MTNIVLRDDNTSENSASVPAPVIRMKDKPLVSVVIPSYNRAALLPEAIETVLQQTYQHFEIIVVDDESTGNTADIAKQYPIRYIFQENQGVSAARNTGILASKGKYIALLDSDDRVFSVLKQQGTPCEGSSPGWKGQNPIRGVLL